MLKECCSQCGFPTEMQRNIVLLDDNIFSYLHYKENTCEECYHQKDGSTIPAVSKLLKDIVDKFNNERRLLIKFINKYTFLTDDERKEVCILLPKFENNKDELVPYNWNVVYEEVINDTKLSRTLINNINWSDSL